MNHAEYTLSAEKRTTEAKAKALRSQKRIPAIVYGNGIEKMNISIAEPDMIKTFRKAGHSTLVTLTVEGKKLKTLIHKIQKNPIMNTISHVDFFVVNLKEKTNVQVPLTFVGESLAIKNLGGILMKEHDELEIRCLPGDIPAKIKVDISSLENIHDKILLKEIKINHKKLEILHLEEGTVICSIAAPKIEVEPTETAPVAETTEEKEDEKEK